MIRCCILTGYGINADRELAEAFKMAGAQPEHIHVGDLIEKPERLDGFRILAFPGGFSFGDHLGSGLVLANLLKQSIGENLAGFIDRGNLVLGICNGFQVLVKMGLLPDISGRHGQEVTLLHNDSGVFEDSWVAVEFEAAGRCVWTAGLPPMELPIRHGEGKFYTASEETLRLIEENSLVALRYRGRNPNGSVNNIAGITDMSGRVLGLMPHPEAFIYPEQHPRWHRERPAEGLGLRLIAAGVARAGG